MSDLISRKVLLDGMSERYNEKVNIVPDNLAEGFVQMESLIKEQPTAFVLESVFQKITELQLSVKDKELNVGDEEYATMLRGRLRGIADVLEILKSATNATNGKNGG